MFDMRSVFHRAKTLSTIVTKQVSYQIFICIFFLRVTSPRLGIRLWGTEGRLCLPCHIHSNTSSTRLLNKTNNCYLFSVFNLFFHTPCHQFYRKEPVIYAAGPKFRDLKSSASVKTRNAANMKNLRTDVCLTISYDFISFFGPCPLLARR